MLICRSDFRARISCLKVVYLLGVKFTKQQHQDIVAEMLAANFQKEDFAFSKKRGRVIVSHNGSDATFSFIYRENLDRDFSTDSTSDNSVYDIKTHDQKVQTVSSWSEVLQEIRMWLEAINRNQISS